MLVPAKQSGAHDFCGTHGMTVPVVQAPMAGGPTTPELVAAVCNAGGLGSLGAEYLSPQQIEKDIRKIRELTRRPFAVNLFSPGADEPLAGNVDNIARFLISYHEQLGIAPPQLLDSAGESFDEQLEVLGELKVPVVSFTLGLLPKQAMEFLKRGGAYVIGTATTVEEAMQLERVGVDAVVAQGSDAGGHRGTFAASVESGLIGTMALVPQVVDAVSIPVLASGGIMDGRGIVAALALGAAAAQMGTAFLACDESGISQSFREALLNAREDQTTVTRAFSGRAARGLKNKFIQAWDESGLTPLSFPWQNALTRPLRRAAANAGDAGLQSLWVGQGVRMLRRGSAVKIMTVLRQQIPHALEKTRQRLPIGLQ